MKYLQDTDNVVALKAIQDLPVKLYTRYNYLVKKHAKNIDGRKSYWLIAWKAFELYFVEIQKIKEARGKGNKLDSFSLHFFTKQFWNCTHQCFKIKDEDGCGISLDVLEQKIQGSPDHFSPAHLIAAFLIRQFLKYGIEYDFSQFLLVFIECCKVRIVTPDQNKDLSNYDSYNKMITGYDDLNITILKNKDSKEKVEGMSTIFPVLINWKSSDKDLLNFLNKFEEFDYE